jgi:hypothetical protein
VIKVAIVDGVATGSAHFTIDAGEAIGSRLPTDVGASVSRPGGAASTTGGSSRPCYLGLRPCGSPGGQEEHTGGWAGGKEL